jgi:glycosyltransferase involved in cell wall biosynthesis
MSDASLLLLIIPDHKSNKSILTGKLFEYIASGKPVICLGPVDGDAAGIIRSTGAGKTFDYNDAGAISNFLMQAVSNPPHPVRSEILKYSRKELTRQIFA